MRSEQKEFSREQQEIKVHSKTVIMPPCDFSSSLKFNKFAKKDPGILYEVCSGPQCGSRASLSGPMVSGGVEKVEMELGAQTYEIVIFTFLNYKVIHCKKRGGFQNLQQEILRIFFKLY